MEKEETIIEETFQESDDGVTWRTIRKTTIITPEGQTDKYEVLGGTPPYLWKLSVWSYTAFTIKHSCWWKTACSSSCKLLSKCF